ncbi:MAG: hypothetical protein COB02_07225 [Candidatus Cloacimonadota bacterium]|nr:MAG: hypothetical protein COB02_07225 [Candidatus Cloacimonadota bacterium]
MKNKLQLSLLLISPLLVSTLFSQTISDKSFQKLMKLSGINKQVAQYPDLVISGMQQARAQGSPISNSQFSEMVEPVKSSFEVTKFLYIIGAEIKQSVSEENAQKLFVWYESKLGKLITKLEEKASTPQAYQDMIQNARSLFSDQERLNIAKSLDNSIGASEMSYQIQKNTATAVFSATALAVDPNPKIAIERFKSQLSTQEIRMRTNGTQMVLLSLIYSYQDVEISKLQKYVDFVDHSDTKAFNIAVVTGMKKAFLQSINTMSAKLAKVFNRFRIDKSKESTLDRLTEESFKD